MWPAVTPASITAKSVCGVVIAQEAEGHGHGREPDAAGVQGGEVARGTAQLAHLESLRRQRRSGEGATEDGLQTARRRRSAREATGRRARRAAQFGFAAAPGIDAPSRVHAWSVMFPSLGWGPSCGFGAELSARVGGMARRRGWGLSLNIGRGCCMKHRPRPRWERAAGLCSIHACGVAAGAPSGRRQGKRWSSAQGEGGARGGRRREAVRDYDPS